MQKHLIFITFLLNKSFFNLKFETNNNINHFLDNNYRI